MATFDITIAYDDNKTRFTVSTDQPQVALDFLELFDQPTANTDIHVHAEAAGGHNIVRLLKETHEPI